MPLKLRVMGSLEEVKAFISSFKNQYIVHQEEESYLPLDMEKEKVFVNLTFEVKPYLPRIANMIIIKLELPEGKHVEIPLIDGFHVSLEEGKTIITGRSYDIFS